MNDKPGTLDPAYGQNGIATPPADPPTPDVRSLQVTALCADADGSLVYYGLNPGEDLPYRFARLDPDGHYPSDGGHVIVQPDEHYPDGSQHCPALFRTTLAERTVYLAAGQPAYFEESTDRVLNYISIARFDEQFQLVPSFGEHGMALPDPGEPWIPIPSGEQSKRRSAHPGITRSPRPIQSHVIGVSDGVIRVIFPQMTEDAFGDPVITARILLLDADSGEQVAGLGEHGEQSALDLTDEDGNPLNVYLAHFLPEGEFIVLAERVDGRMVLKRYEVNGLVRRSFAGGAVELDLFSYTDGLRPGLAVDDSRIVITRAISSKALEPTTVFCFDLEGERDSEFNDGQPLTLKPADGGLVLNRVGIDTHARIVLAGDHLTRQQGMLCVARLERSGALDKGFADGGYFEMGRDLISAGGLFLDPDAIRVASQFPTFQGAFLDRAIKLLA